MTTYTITRVDHKNAGIAREWAVCNYYGIERTIHDNVRYDLGSDVETTDGKEISVKASGFSLMSGNLCEGLEDFDSIWSLYENHVHSNVFAYVTEDFTVYEMDLNEFKKFVYAFGATVRESQKNGGAVKIRLRKESKKMVNWLNVMAAS